MRHPKHPIFAAYEERLIHLDRDPQTFNNNFQSMARYDEWLNGRDPVRIDHSEIIDFQRFLLRHYKLSTAKQHLVRVKAFYTHAQGLGLVNHNPCLLATKMWPREEDVEPRILTPDELRALHSAIESDRERTAFHILLWSGMRSKEMRDLRWEDVDFANNELILRCRKGGRFGRVPMHPILKEVLLAERQQARTFTQRYVLESAHHEKMSKAITTRMWRALFDRAGLTAEYLGTTHTSHLFRKTLSTDLGRRGVRPDVVETILGWKPDNIRARHYTGRVDADLHEGIRKAFEDALIVPEQAKLETEAALGEPETIDEVELLRLRLAVLEAENRNLELKSHVTA